MGSLWRTGRDEQDKAKKGLQRLICPVVDVYCVLSLYGVDKKTEIPYNDNTAAFQTSLVKLIILFWCILIV